MPTLYHSLAVQPKGKSARTEKVYSFADFPEGREGRNGEAWWTTYRYQLEAFVDRVRGRESSTGVWVEKEESVANMAWIEAIYAKTELGGKLPSTYVHYE